MWITKLGLCSVLTLALVAIVLGERVFYPTEVPEEWSQLDGSLPRDFPVRLTFALKQRNLDVLEQRLLEVSDPTSPKYGQHLSLSQLAALIGPKVASQARLRSFLIQNGFHSFDFTAIGDYVVAESTVENVERMLSTQLRKFHSTNAPLPIIRAVSTYTIPTEIDDILHSIPGLHGFQYKKQSLINKQRSVTAGATVVPSDIIGRYQITEPTSAVAGSSQAVVEFDLNWYSPSDLQTFFTKFAPSQSGRQINQIYGNNRPDLHTGVEANLDVQYIMGIGWNVNTTAYTMPPDSDILNSFMQYTQLVNNQTSPPLVHSISFGEYGGNYPNSTVQLIDTEFQKMGVRGVSVLVASGDNGVGCNKQCTSQEFDFPSSPYITLVGSTEFLSSTNETGAKFSSGGFSRDQWRPSYQNTAVQNYFNSGVKLPASSYYFANGRAYPDVSAVGVNIDIVVNGKTEPVDGTSCSAPIFAGIVSLLNNYRLSKGKAPLGFLNPLLYQNPQAFTDIISGSNPYLCCPGFQAAKGWDPVTGLGTPLYPKLLSVVQQLP